MTAMIRITLKPRPVVEIDPVDQLIAEAERYGPNYYKCKPWHDRGPAMQEIIENALRAFLRWRRDRGEDLPDLVVWEASLPDSGTVRIYVHKLSSCSGKWRQWGFAAMRHYFRHHDRPDLFRLVERTRGR